MRRAAGIGGLLFVLLTMIPVLIADTPPAAGASAADIASYYSVANRGAQLFANWLGAVGIVPSFVFFAGILAIVREAEGERAWRWLVALLGLAAAFVTVTVLVGLDGVLSFSAQTIDPGAARVLVDLGGLLFVVYLLPMVAFFGAVGAVITKCGALPRWLGYGAYVAGAGSAVGTLGLFWPALQPGGFGTILAFGLQLLWWLAASVALLLPEPYDPAASVRRRL